MQQSEIPLRIRGDAIMANDGTFVWYSIPKCASRSLAAVLAPHGRRLKDIEQGRKLLKKLAAPPYSFAFVRCPYDRIISLWRNKVLNPPDTPAQAELFADWPGLTAGMDLDTFVDWLDQHFEEENCNDHWRPQHQFIATSSGEICVSFLGRLERLDRDIQAIGTRLSLDLRIGRLNASPPGDGATLSPGARMTINRIYRRDFELLAYEMG